MVLLVWEFQNGGCHTGCLLVQLTIRKLVSMAERERSESHLQCRTKFANLVQKMNYDYANYAYLSPFIVLNLKFYNN